MQELTGVKIGDRLCVLGFGTAGGVHEHHVVTSISKLYVTSQSMPSRRHTRQHRIRDGRSPGGDGYGGTEAATRCQQPKPRS